jgi:hypothetical protein
MREWALKAAANKPCVECVVAVFDQDCAMREAKKCTPHIAELWGSDEHGAVDLMSLLRVRVDRRAAIDERVEERKGTFEVEALRSHLEDQERGIASRLDVERDELSIVEPRRRTDVRRINCDLVPGNGLFRAARFQKDRLHERRLMADCTKAISSLSIVRKASTAAK